MIYVNGDGFAAASYANCSFSWSSQDENQRVRGNLIHPVNLTVSFGKILSLLLHQPYRNEAYEFNSYSKIFRDTYNIIEKENITNVIIIWPTVYNGEVLIDGKYHQFIFNNIDDLADNEIIKNSMYDYMRSFETNNAYATFESNINELCRILDSKGIKHLMISNDKKLPTGNANWLLKETIQNWANTENLLNPNGFLTVNGHKNLTKLIFQSLTNQ